MKSKLIACILGLSIIISSGTPVLAEAGDASAGPAVQEAEVQPPQEPAAPPAADPGSDAGGTVIPAGDPASDPGSGPGIEPGNDPGSTVDSGAGQDPTPADVPQGGDDPSSGSEGTGSEGETPAADQSDTGIVTDPSASDLTSESVNEDPVSEISGSSSGSSAESTATAESSTSVPEENPDKEDSKEDNKDPEEEEKDPEEEKEDPEEENKEVLVTGFSGVAEIVVKKKPSLTDAMAMLPTVVEAVLSDGNRIYVPVDWSCVSDYNDKKADRFTFASSLKKNPDGSAYNIGHPIAPGVRFPTATIVIKEESEQKESEDKKETKEETKNPVTEDKPLVMDDVTAANLSPDEGEEQVFLFLMKELGLNRAAACGVLANIHYESGFNSHAIGDGGTSYGICQWHAGRYLELVSYCEKIKMPYGSVEGQLQYLEQELKTNYSGVFEYLKNVPETEIGAYDAAYHWCYYFESPAMILRQSTLRGNASKNSYWPRYKDADLDLLEKRSKADSALERDLIPVTSRLEEANEQADQVLDRVSQAVFEDLGSQTEEKNQLTAAASGETESISVTRSAETKPVAKEKTDAEEKAENEETVPLLRLGDSIVPSDAERSADTDKADKTEMHFFDGFQKTADESQAEDSGITFFQY